MIGGRVNVILSVGVSLGSDKASPVPVALPHGVHGVERDALSLRQEEGDEERHGGDPGGVEEEGAVLEVAEHGEEGLGQHEGGAEVDGHADALPSGPDFHGEDLARDQPAQRAPRPPESRGVRAHQHQD